MCVSKDKRWRDPLPRVQGHAEASLHFAADLAPWNPRTPIAFLLRAAFFLQFWPLFSFGKSEDKSGLTRTEIWVATPIVAIRSPTKQTEMKGTTQ